MKFKLPLGKVASFAAKLILKARDGITKEEAEEILADLIILLGDVLMQNGVLDGK